MARDLPAGWEERYDPRIERLGLPPPYQPEPSQSQQSAYVPDSNYGRGPQYTLPQQMGFGPTQPYQQTSYYPSGPPPPNYGVPPPNYQYPPQSQMPYESGQASFASPQDSGKKNKLKQGLAVAGAAGAGLIGGFFAGEAVESAKERFEDLRESVQELECEKECDYDSYDFDD
ncbi:15185_t:CDS:2 [Acaulospora colombiana]|uniref:15185_t:CDS:1 n=1 Tax=Acaulospora colombiana TaxID=27376 RepID=A0ACA9L3I6_9GLOM|nr:15185_t:CDS:2 [Acaulospora colombiana]